MKKWIEKVLFLLVVFMGLQCHVYAFHTIGVGNLFSSAKQTSSAIDANEQEEATFTTTTDRNITITDVDTTTYQIEVETNKDTGITWESSNTDVATVDENGLVRIFRNGKTVIKAKLNGYDLSKAFFFTVSFRVKSLDFQFNSTINPNFMDDYYVININGPGSIYPDYYPKNAADPRLQWEVEDEEILSLSQPYGVGNSLTGKKVGTTKVIGTTTDGSNLRIEVPVRVLSLYTALQTYNNFQSLKKGETYKMEYMGIPSNIPKTEKLTFRSTNEKVVTVDSEGNVKAVGVGRADVYVESSISKLSSSTQFTITNPLQSISFPNTQIYVKKGTDIYLKYEPNPIDADDIVKRVHQTSNQSIVSRIDNDGHFFANELGEALVSVVVNDKFLAKCKVIVVDYLKGDLNDDGMIDATDLLLMNKLYFGKIEMTDTYLKVGDLNGNGEIDLSDILILTKTYFGKI